MSVEESRAADRKTAENIVKNHDGNATFPAGNASIFQFFGTVFYLSRRDMKELMLEFGKRVGAFLVVALVLSAYLIVSL